MATNNIEDWLSEHTEYSAVCDNCDNESTRDSSSHFATNNAKAEGFVVTPDFAVLCAKCANELAPESVAVGA